MGQGGKGVDLNSTRDMSKAKRKHAQEDISSFRGKWGLYKVLDGKIIEGQKTAPMIDYFV